MGFLGNIGRALFGSSSKIKTKTMYQPEDYSMWLNQVMGDAEPYLANLLSQYFGATAPTMGGAFGGQQGSYAAQGVASQLPYFANLAGGLMQGQKQLYEKPGSPGLVGSLAPGIGLGLGAASVPFLGKLLGGGATGIPSTPWKPYLMGGMSDLYKG